MENDAKLTNQSIATLEILSSRRPWRIWLAAAIIGISIGYFGAMIAKAYLVERNVGTVEYAPDFSLELFSNGETLTLLELRGKGVVLNFWASWCYPCRTEMPALQAAWETYREDGIVFVGVNLWDHQPDALEFLAEYSVTYPNGFDMLGNIDDDYFLLGIPTTWFIYPDGTVARKVMGPLDLESLDELIAVLLSN